jgi:poly(hydroxyalkanoate) granule-associated protein
MVKKLKALAEGGASGEERGNLAKTVRDSAQSIWLAGLGAFSKAQEEGGKVFEALVKEGKGLEAQTRRIAEKKFSEVTEQFGRKTESATAKATATWDKLEQVFEDRVARALGRLGVPTNKEIQSLASRVEELTATVRTLSGKGGKGAKAAKATKTAKRAATRRAAS